MTKNQNLKATGETLRSEQSIAFLEANQQSRIRKKVSV